MFAPVSDHSVAAGATIDLGGFNQTIGSLAGAGTVTLGAGTLTTGGSGASTTFVGTITGAGGVNKVGAGVFALAGVDSYTGATTVNAGGLQLFAGTVLASGITVQNGAYLAAGGTAAGESPAHIASLNTLAGSTLQLAPTTAAGPVIAAAGAVTLAGNILLTPATALEVPRTSLLLLTGSSVTDNRALVTSVGPLRAVADPGPTSFSVTLVSGERDLAQGPLQLAVASAVDADVLAGRNTLVSRSLAAGTVAEQGADLRALSGVGLTAYETAAVAGEQRFQSTIGAHIAGFDTRSGPARQLAIAAGALPGGAANGAVGAALLTAASAPTDANDIFWIEGAGAFGDFAANGDAPAVRISGGGVVIGAEATAFPGVRLGVAVGYDSSSLDAEGLVGSARSDAYRVAGYGRASLGEHAPWIGFGVDYARTVATGGRDIAIGTAGAVPLVGSTSARPDGDTVGGQVRVGEHFAVSGFDVVPAVAVEAFYYDRGGFTEGGQTGAELTVADRRRTGVRTIVGGAASRGFAVGDGMTLTPAAGAGWAHELADRGAAIDASFAGGGSVFRANGVKPGRDGALLSASSTLQATTRLAAYLGYDATLARGETVQGVTGGLRLTW